MRRTGNWSLTSKFNAGPEPGLFPSSVARNERSICAPLNARISTRNSPIIAFDGESRSRAQVAGGPARLILWSRLLYIQASRRNDPMTFAIAPNLAGDFGVYDALGNALTGEVDVLLEELPVV